MSAVSTWKYVRCLTGENGQARSDVQIGQFIYGGETPGSRANCNPKVIPNEVTPEGRELGEHLARFCDQEAEKAGRDGRCGTCAFRAGDHLANGSPATLMSALKCVMEREPFWCHEHDAPCAGWLLMRSDVGDERTMPWDHAHGAEDRA